MHFLSASVRAKLPLLTKRASSRFLKALCRLDVIPCSYESAWSVAISAIAVAEEGSLSAAAQQRLRTAQPSRQMAPTAQ
jgi:hypothetical protein